MLILRFALIVLLAGVGGCAQNFVTPGGAAPMLEFADDGLIEHFATRPATRFPATLATARIQAPRGKWYTSGRYAVVTSRELETEDSLQVLRGLANVRGVAPLGRLLLPPQTNSMRDLRIPAAKLHADMLLVYTVDTVFSIDGRSLGPLSVISLGLIPNKKAHVSATVSGILIDVRTGFVYGTTEATQKRVQRTTLWSTRDAINRARRDAEQHAFDDFVESFATLWPEVVATYDSFPMSPPQLSDAGNPPYRYHSVDFEADKHD